MSFSYLVILTLCLLAVGGLIRILAGPTVWDRLLGLSLVSTKIMVAIVAFAALMDRSFLMDVAIIYSLLGFIASVLISRFIEQKGQP